MNVRGNTAGIRDSIIEKLENVYDMEISKTSFASIELIKTIAEITSKINREICIYIDRFGNIIDVAVGDDKTVALQDMSRRRGIDRLSGVRSVHTHPNGNTHLSAIDKRSLMALRFDGMCVVGVQDGNVTGLSIGFIEVLDGSLSNDTNEIQLKLDDIENPKIMDIVFDIEKSIKLTDALYDIEKEKERVILVGVKLPEDDFSEQESIDELKELAISAGAEVIDKIIQSKEKIDKAYYIGTGKAAELSLLAQASNATAIIFDNELSPIQLRNLEMITGIKILDRTTLILDIFAQRAKSNEGKLQVELAQLKFRLPRLLGLGASFSQQGGGIGSRGPGEKKLETDRRHIMRKITQLQKDIKEIKKNRDIQRKQREESGIPRIALVGYTNAGKSTLLNTLTDAGVLVENKLFATLDPTTRKVELEDGQTILVTDTVGFVNKLPHSLVDAFKSTLEETVHADLLVHVIDASNSSVEFQIETVEKVLHDLDAKNIPTLVVFNKIDKIQNDEKLKELKSKIGNYLEISALNKLGIEELLLEIQNKVGAKIKEVTLSIPYDKAHMESKIRNLGKVKSTDYEAECIKVKLLIDEKEIYRIKEYIIEE